MSTIQKHEDLIVWQKAHKFVIEVYSLTKIFPNAEKFALANQLNRAAVSVASNIVEGFYRVSVNERKRFYIIARASLEEAKYQLLIAKDLNYFSFEKYQIIINLSNEVGKLLNGWTKIQK